MTLEEARPEGLEPKAAAIVLAGGGSTRMGRDKSLLPVQGRPLVQHVVEGLRPLAAEILLSANEPEKYAFLGLPVVPDERPGLGPLMGIVSALRRSAHELNLVVACDMPAIDTDFARMLLESAQGYDCVVPLNAGGRPEPLLAVYRKSVLPAAQALLDSGQRKIALLFDTCRVRYVPLPPGVQARNINTPEEYAALAQELAQPEA